MPGGGAEPDDVAVGVLEDDRLDELVVTAVGDELAVADVAPSAAQVALVGDALRGAGPAAVGAPVDRMSGLLGVRRQEHLVSPPARQPWPIAVVALDRSSIPSPAAVRGREERIVREVDARVVHAAAGVLGQVGIAEARVLSGIGEEPGPQIVEALPVAAVVVGAPEVHLIPENTGF